MRLFPLALALPTFVFACTERPAASPPPSLAPSPVSSPSADRAAPVASAPAPSAVADRTIIDHDDIALELPGQWEQLRTPDGGYDLRRGKEQIIVSTVPLGDGLDATASAEKLSLAQRKAVAQAWNCVETGDVRRVTAAHLGAVRSAVTCPNPALVISFAAATHAAGDRVISYEHYWYTATSVTPEMERADTANLETLRLKSSQKTCPATVLAWSQKQGTCLDAAILGEGVVEDCIRQLESLHRVRDEGMAAALGSRVGKHLVCYRVGGAM